MLALERGCESQEIAGDLVSLEGAGLVRRFGLGWAVVATESDP